MPSRSFGRRTVAVATLMMGLEASRVDLGGYPGGHLATTTDPSVLNVPSHPLIEARPAPQDMCTMPLSVHARLRVGDRFNGRPGWRSVAISTQS